MFFCFCPGGFLHRSTRFINSLLFFSTHSLSREIPAEFYHSHSTFIKPQHRLVLLDSQTKLCYDLFVKGCDEDTRKGKIPREEAIW